MVKNKRVRKCVIVTRDTQTQPQQNDSQPQQNATDQPHSSQQGNV